MSTAVIILHYGSIKTTENCLLSLKPKLGQNSLILINNTLDDLTAFQKLIPHTKLINNTRNLGFAAGVNEGIKLALKDPQTDSIFLMNNDLQFSFGSLKELRRTLFSSSHVGIVSPVLHHQKVYDWGGKFSRLKGSVRHQNWPNRPKTLLSATHLAGAAMLIRREVISKVGLFDERFFLYFEDLDFCLRTKAAGFELQIDPQVVADHAVSAGSRPFRRTLYQWQSHFLFVTKYLFRPVWPTAYLYGIIFYSLVLLKILLFSK